MEVIDSMYTQEVKDREELLKEFANFKVGEEGLELGTKWQDTFSIIIGSYCVTSEKEKMEVLSKLTDVKFFIAQRRYKDFDLGIDDLSVKIVYIKGHLDSALDFIVDDDE
jgi:hypothetical protein